MRSQEPPLLGGTPEDLALWDPELRFRRVAGLAALAVSLLSIALSLFHIYTAGFGVLLEMKHRAVHLSLVLALTFLLYPARRKKEGPRAALIYEGLFSLTAAGLVAFGLREAFGFRPALPFLLTFFLSFYYRRRDRLGLSLLPGADLLAGGLGLTLLVYLTNRVFSHFPEIVGTSGTGFRLWLFVVLGALFFVLSLQAGGAALSLLRGRPASAAEERIPYFDILLAILAASFSTYLIADFGALVSRAGLPIERDLLVGGMAILLVLEGARRAMGPDLPLLALACLAYGYFGPQLLGVPLLDFFAHRGYSLKRIIEHMYMGTEGIYGIPLGVVATFVFHFVLFGIFISATGLGQLFIEIALALAGRSTGGPAKVAVISSGLLGSINGSSIANTVTTGSLTIPLMKRIGYKAHFAGAVEATASTGGQITPPIMGAAAFIMAEFLGIPYVKIAAAAILPAYLHYLGVGTMVHLEAAKLGLRGLPREEIPRLGGALRERGLMLIPLFMIVHLLLRGHSPFLAAFWGIILSASLGQVGGRRAPLLLPILLSLPLVAFGMEPLGEVAPFWFGALAAGGAIFFRLHGGALFLPSIGVSLLMPALSSGGLTPLLSAFWANLAVVGLGWLSGGSRLDLRRTLSALEWGARSALSIGAACACVGFIVGAATLTGLGLKFAQATVQLAHGTGVGLSYLIPSGIFTLFNSDLFFTLLYTMIACTVLGSGLPTTATYIILSIIAAPALMTFNVPLLVAHMFVLYYGVLADVTPPVALAAYAGAGIAGSNPFRTGFTAFRLASAKAIVPFAFVYSPALLLLPWLLEPGAGFSWGELLRVTISASLGVIALGAGMTAYLRLRTRPWEQLLLFLSALLLLLWPGGLPAAGGLGLLVLIYLNQRLREGPKG